MDYTVEDTIYLMFTSRAFATGIPTVLAGTPVVSAYENDSAVQITAGITLGVDHDSVVGMNLLTIVATAANGYEAGKDYNLVITTGTVDSVSVVGEVVGTFSLGRSAAAKPADVWSDSTPPAGAAMSRAVDGIVLGTASGTPTTTSIPTSSLVPAASVIDQFQGRIVTFDDATTTAALRGQSTDITANTAAGILTVTALTTAPVSGDTFTIQ